MNHAKIAAALHALADAFLADVEAVEAAITGKPARGKAKAAEAAAAATAPAASPASAPAATASAAAVEVPAEPAPVLPTVTLKEVNALVLKLAATHRDDAVALLGKLKLTNTVGLAQERWQEVYDAFEEAIAKRDAAAVQVAQASLV